MLALLRKEINAFLGSLIGYLVIIVFLTIIGLFMWIFPGELNILEAGYSQLGTFFYLAPWVFLFLIPAITMRSFAEEKKSGTHELLLTKPLPEMQIILSKFLAGLLLVLFSVLPGLIDPHIHLVVGDWNPRQSVFGPLEGIFNGGVTTALSQGDRKSVV